MTDNPRTEKHEQVRHSLPDELQPVFDELVDNYKFATFRRYRQSFVAYIVFADLVRVGWRRTADPIEDRRTEKHEQVRHSLPDELQPVFDELVDNYKFATSRRYGQGVVAYIILADLVLGGWRHPADPIKDQSTDEDEQE